MINNNINHDPHANPYHDEDFAARLSTVVDALGITQLEFATRLGCTPTFISNVLRGKSKPGLDLIHRIAAVSDVDLNWLISGIGSFTRRQAIDQEWFRMLDLRTELVRLASAGDPEAVMLLAEILGDAPKRLNISPSREKLVDHLTKAVAGSTLTAQMYSRFPPAHGDSQRLDEATRALIAHFRTNNTDPLTAIIRTTGRDSKP